MKIINIITYTFGILLISVGILSYLADYNYKNHNYDKAIATNPFEPRYKMKYLLYQDNPNYIQINKFYKKNHYNPYVAEYILLWYKGHLSETNFDLYKELLVLAKHDYPESPKVEDLYNEVFP